MKTFLSAKRTVKYITLSILLIALVSVFFINDNKKAVVPIPAKIQAIAVSTVPATAPDKVLSPLNDHIVLTKEEKEKKRAVIEKKMKELETSFRKNVGQWDEQILYKTKNSGIDLSFIKNGLSYGVGRGEGKQYEQLVWNETFQGMNENVTIAEGNKIDNSINYIIGTGGGNNKTINNIPDFTEITYQNVYNNIDVKYYPSQSPESEMETDFILKPGSDVRNIKMQLDGIKGLSIDKKGILSVKNEWGTLREYIPSSYQMIDGEKKEVTVKYKLNDETSYGFEICGIYDHSKELVIDPVILDWATFAGPINIKPGQPGFTGEEKQGVLNDVVCDDAGFTYATGWCQTGFPVTAGSYQPGNAGQLDVLIFKMNQAATALVYGTYVGTTDGGAITATTGEIGWGIDIDAAGNAYVTGSTDRATFPTTAGAYQTTLAGTIATFVLKLNPAGSGLVYSTLLGTGSEGMSVRVLSTGEAIVGGYTGTGHPTTGGAFQTAFGGGRDGFITKFNAAGTGIVYSTYVGGSANDTVFKIAPDAAGNIYAAGTTGSTNFPVTAGTYQAAKAGLNDAFLFKLNTTGSALVYSTFFGGTSAEEGYGVDVNSAGQAYICGGTNSTNLPTLNPYQAATKGKGDAFVAKFNAGGSGLIYSTYLGGTQDDVAWDVVVDCNDEAFVTGHSRLTSPGTSICCGFPLSSCPFYDVVGAGVSAAPPGCNNFISKFSPAGALLYSGTKFTGAAYTLRCAMDIIQVNCCVQGVVAGGTTGHEVTGYDFITTPGVFEQTDPRWTKFSTPWLYRISPKPNTTVNVTAGPCLAARTFTATVDTCFGKPSLTWKFGDGATATGTPVVHTYAATGTYTVTVIADCPHDSVIKTVTIADATPCGPSVSAVGGPVCPGTCFNLTATSTAGTSPYTYSWNPGSGTGSSFNVCPASTTTYTVTTTDSGGKTASTTAKVTVNGTPTANITGIATICAGTSTTLTGTGGGTYSWNTGAVTTAITVSPSGNTSYSVTVTNASGCTGTAGISVIVNPIPVVTVPPATICAGTSTTLTATGGGTYVWSTTEITPSITVSPAINTTYTVTATNTGCTGSTTVAVTVAANLIPVITGVTTICNGTSTTLSTTGGGTYLWNDGTTNSSIIVSPTINPTSYSVTVTNGSCSGTASVQVTVNPNPTPTISGNTSVCSGMSTLLTASGGTTYVWDGGQTTPSITVSPTVQTTYTVTATTNGCTGQTSIVVGITPPPTPTITGTMAICIGGNTTLTANGGGTYLWNTGATSPSITVTPGTTTSYSVVVTTGCSASATAQVTVQSSLVPTIVGPSTICNGTSITLTTSGGGTYSWNDGTTNVTITANPTVNTTYSVTVVNGLCSGTAQHPVVVNPNPAPVIAGNMTICAGSSTTLTANAGGTYSWSPGGQTTPSIAVNPTNPTNTYTVTVTTNGCTGMTTAQVTVNPIPAPVIPGPITICAGQSTILTSTGTSGPYVWNTGDVTAGITVTPASTKTYSVSVTVNGCTGTAAQTVIVIPQVIAKTSGKNICAGQSTTLTASGGTTYLWSTGATTTSITVNPATTTTYTVITAVGSCADTAISVITVNPLPIADATGDTTITYGTSTPLVATGGGTYTWIPPVGLSCYNCPNPMATPTAATQYCVIVQTPAGCADTSCVKVLIDLKCGDNGELFVPNGFSPNADGENDVLYVYGGGVVGIYWAIYDRWGEKVFETTNPKQGWDGTYKGKLLDPAVFVYYLKVTCFSGDDIIQKGNVAIIK